MDDSWPGKVEEDESFWLCWISEGELVASVGHEGAITIGVRWPRHDIGAGGGPEEPGKARVDESLL